MSLRSSAWAHDGLPALGTGAHNFSLFNSYFLIFALFPPPLLKST
jgi:hypothetical protein